MNADPVHDLRAMKLDGLGADAEDPGDLLGRLAGSDQAKDLGLSRCQAGRNRPVLILDQRILDARRQVTTAGKDGAEGETQLVQDEILVQIT